MNRAVFFLLIFSLGMIFYTAGAPTEIAQKTIVSAIGIDRMDSKEEMYRVTMQVFRPSGSGSQTAIDPSLPNVSIVKGEGETVGRALNDCRSKLSGDMYIGKNRIILFGSKTPLSECDDILSALLNDPECWYKVNCAAAEGTAEEMLEIPLVGNALASVRFVQMIEASSESGCCMTCTFDELYLAVKNGSGSVIMPMFSPIKGAEPENKAGENGGGSSQQLEDVSGVELNKGAVYVGGNYKFPIDRREMGLLAAVNGKGHYLASKKGGIYRVLSREIKANEIDGEPCVEVDLSIYCKTRLEDDKSKDEEKKLCKEAERLLQRLNSEADARALWWDTMVRACYPNGVPEDVKCVVIARGI